MFFSMSCYCISVYRCFRREIQRFSVWVLLIIGIHGISGGKVSVFQYGYYCISVYRVFQEGK